MGAQEPRGREGPARAQPCRDTAHTPRGVHGQRPGISVTDTAPPPPPRTPPPPAATRPSVPGVARRLASPAERRERALAPPWPGLVPRRPRRCLSARWLLAAPTPGVCGAAAPSLAHAPHGTTGPRVHLWGPVWPSPMGTPSTSRPRARRRPRLSETAAGPGAPARDARGSAVWGPRFAGLPWAGGCAPPPAGARPHSRAHGTRPRRWGHGGLSLLVAVAGTWFSGHLVIRL